MVTKFVLYCSLYIHILMRIVDATDLILIISPEFQLKSRDEPITNFSIFADPILMPILNEGGFL